MTEVQSQDFWIGVILWIRHSAGIECSDRLELCKWWRGWQSAKPQYFRTLGPIPSKPVAFVLSTVDRVLNTFSSEISMTDNEDSDGDIFSRVGSGVGTMSEYGRPVHIRCYRSRFMKYCRWNSSSFPKGINVLVYSRVARCCKVVY